MDTSIKRKVEQAFAEWLNERIQGARCYTSKGDEADIPLPYIAAIAQSAREVIPRSNTYELDVKIVLISSIDNATSDDHEAMVAAIKAALDEVPRPWSVPTAQVYVNGFVIVQVNSSGSDADEVFGDIWTMKVGAQG